MQSQYQYLRDIAQGKTHPFRTWARYNIFTLVLLSGLIAASQVELHHQKEETEKLKERVKAQEAALTVGVDFLAKPVTMIISTHSQNELYQRLTHVAGQVDRVRNEIKLDVGLGGMPKGK